jgi:FtsP/CotA-like multicopper oxidase with cupredoxin domain
MPTLSTVVRRRGAAALGALLLVVAGCASGSGGGGTSATAATGASSASAPSSGGSGSATPAADVALTFTVAGGKATPGFQQVQVTQGQTVSITVTSDKDDELHVHGYDKELPLHAGTPATVTFTADQTGQFEVETHESGLRLASLVVR